MSLVDPGARVALGVSTPALAADWAHDSSNAELTQVNEFERLIGKHVQIVMWFADWAHSRFDASKLRQVAARGSIPEITWEPWDASRGIAGTTQSRYTLKSIIEGRHDALIWSWARGIRQYRAPILLRFAREMNLATYPWSERANGNRRGQFVRAWRHVHDIFMAAGATNARWVWSPVAGPLDPGDYPGRRYVDVLGLSGFNGGALLPWGGWATFQRIYGGWLPYLHNHIDPTKPVQISEIGSAEQGGDKARWVADMFKSLSRYPYVTSLISFDLRKEADWRIDSSPAALRAFVAGAASTRLGQLSVSSIAGRTPVPAAGNAGGPRPRSRTLKRS